MDSTSYLFQSRAPGTVTVTEFKYPTTPAVLSVKSQGKEFNSIVSNTSAILTQIDLAQHVNVQFMPTLADLVYVYSFGDRMGDITLQGIAFAGSCEKIQKNGAEAIMDFYDQHRAVHENRIVTVTVGRAATLRGYLTDMRVSQSNSEMRTSTFSLQLAAMPRRAT